jgi:hypothetical protein
MAEKISRTDLEEKVCRGLKGKKLNRPKAAHTPPSTEALLSKIVAQQKTIITMLENLPRRMSAVIKKEERRKKGKRG